MSGEGFSYWEIWLGFKRGPLVVWPSSKCWPGASAQRKGAETEPELCLIVSREDTGQQQPAAGALGAADLGMASRVMVGESHLKTSGR